MINEYPEKEKEYWLSEGGTAFRGIFAPGDFMN